jgi:type 2 lantibiotic biosynthesis protein LanM
MAFQMRSGPVPIPEHLQGCGLAGCLVAATPMIQSARERVRRGAQDLVKAYPGAPFHAESVEESLAANLAEQLLQITARVMVLELNVARLEGVLDGETPEERFASYINRLRQPEIMEQLFREYPVLSEQIASRLEKWTAFSLEFLKHLCEDWPPLRPFFGSSTPGALVKIQNSGDTHRHGRSVMIASFASGERIVYKPRSLVADERFQQLLAWLNARGAQPEFRVLKILDRGEHGWSEFVSPAPCITHAELSRFYQRQGGYLALLYAMEACDFHCENVIASGEHPVLIDLETLFSPRLDHFSWQRANDLAGAALACSVLGVGLLPQRIRDNEEQTGVDVSGLGTCPGQLTPERVPQWERADTDEMRMVRKRIEIPGSENRPTLNGHQVNPVEYTEPVAGGFAETYRLLLKNRSELLTIFKRFSAVEVRVIARPTQRYAKLLNESFHPDLMRNRCSYMAHFDLLHAETAYRPSLDRLVDAEQKDLLRGDIPLFSTTPSSRDIWTTSGERIENCVSESGMSLAEQRIGHLCPGDLERQLWIVRASMATLGSDSDGPTRKALSAAMPENQAAIPDELISTAREIGDRLAELAFGTDGDGDAVWIGLVPAGEREWRLSPLGADLYDGLPGIILFLAYLGMLSGETRYSSLAKDALKTVRDQIEQFPFSGNIGAFSGWGGVIYLFAHLGVLWADRSLFSEAEQLLTSVSTLIETDKKLDVIGGAAGYALSLLALHKCNPSARTLETARACGEHLLGRAQAAKLGIGWYCISGAAAPLTGFAHGNAGIAYALLAIARSTGEARFEQAALRAFDYERSLYSPEQRNWPDLRSTAGTGFVSAWCHGAPGIGLSRLCSLRLSSDSQFAEEIEAALTTTAQSFSGNHTLCHGDLGNADILLFASETLKNSDWRLYADQIATTAIKNARRTGWICGNSLGVESPGLMTGLAGIGYALLRLGAPTHVPSVLALEAPVLS